MLIKRATLLDGRRVDIRVADRIGEVAETLTQRPGEEVFDAAGMTVLPGLHDHHVHIHSAAATSGSVRVGPGVVADRTELGRALQAAAPGDDGWIRGIDYHEAAAGELDRRTLDQIAPRVPVRIQHRTGVLWMVNSAGLRELGLADHPDGRLRSADPTWSTDRRELRLGDWSRRLLEYGVTGITDATPDLDPGDLDTPRGSGELVQRVHTLAPGKRILHDDALDLDELADWIRARHALDTPVAVHCVTAAQLVVTLAALRIAGGHARDRIEHAAIVPDDCVADLAQAGVTVVTQPNFVAERGDRYLVEVPAGEHDELWRVATLLEAGVPVALSTDTPFGHGDPWAAMRAAVHRRTPGGAVLGPAERITAAAALTMFTGSGDRPAAPRTVGPGEPGDLLLLTAPPGEVLAELDAELVTATVVAGAVVHHI
ncbi:amidohydrolase family protein [Mycolicibacterium sp. S2-37]|uniref:amidohydrolase family protein n=1 Tax=Mycolicibacterium sp. S2-37 TaxID=2810297 RepID=UPI001A93C64A|nr:amidohydrolase family protein [Mycolicibacterium sp. S2-37]MBO0678496.1 amidohydrolase family protein [Mycolicibacterium sp. S2-37]